MSWKTRSAVGGAVACAASLVFMAPAHAASESASSKGTACVQAASQEGASVTTPHCFARFDDAISFATGGTVHLQNAASARAVSAAELAPAGVAATAPISIMYADYQFGGDSYIWTGTTCTSSNSYASPSMPSGWDNRVGSVRTYQNCRNDLYYDTGYHNVVFNIAANTNQSSLGAMNDNASSQKWHA